MEFKEVKEIIVKRAKEKNACSDEYSKLLKVESLEKLMNLIKTNSLQITLNIVSLVRTPKGFASDIVPAYNIGLIIVNYVILYPFNCI